MEKTMKQDCGSRLGKIVQVAIVCRDIVATSRRWAKLLGVDSPEIIETDPGDKVGMIYRGRTSNDRVKLAFFDTGETTLELLQPIGENSSWWEILDQSGECVHHIAFQVSDEKRVLEKFSQQGMNEFHRGRFDSQDGTYIYVDSRKELGVPIELLIPDGT
jgi:hypothetical protein